MNQVILGSLAVALTWMMLVIGYYGLVAFGYFIQAVTKLVGSAALELVRLIWEAIA